MQKLAGLITENHFNQLTENESKPTHKSKVDWYYINDDSDYPGPKGRTVPNAEGFDNPKEYEGTELYIAKGTKGYVSGNRFEDEDGNDVGYKAEYFEKISESQVNENLIINEEFDNRINGFSNIFLKTYYDMSNHIITFDEAVDKLFTWIKANFK